MNAVPCHAMLLGHSCDRMTSCNFFMALSVWFVVVCIYLSMYCVKCIFEMREVEGVVRTR
jgi:hypothetical protein